METTRVCAVCSDECKFKCGGCHARFYCGEPHQIQDWPSHSKSCYPVLSVQKMSSAECHLMATRSINALEIIYTEKPLVFGPAPSYHPKSITNGCPICYKVCSSGKFSCPKCSIIMCSSTCHKHKDHIPECTFLKVAKPAARRKLGVSLKPYNLILIFRCLWIKHADPNSWNEFLQMKYVKKEPLAKEKDTDAHKLKLVYKLDNFSEEEINHTLTAVRLFLHGFTNGQAGIYQNFWLLEEDCNQNIILSVNIDKEMIVKAACDIKSNEFLSRPAVFPYYGVGSRRVRRQEYTKRVCNCDKCQDPTDMGTYISSIYCLDCETGHLLPPIMSQEEWRCESCNKPESNLVVESILSEFKNELDMSTNIKSLHNFLENSKNSLCDNNYMRLAAKYSLCCIYTNEIMDNPEIVEKYGTHLYSLAEEIVYVLNKVCPEYVLIKGSVYFYMLCPLSVKLYNKYNEEKLITRRNFYKMTRYFKAVNLEDPYDESDINAFSNVETYIQAILELLLFDYSKTNIH